MKELLEQLRAEGLRRWPEYEAVSARYAETRAALAKAVAENDEACKAFNAYNQGDCEYFYCCLRGIEDASR